MDAKTKRMMWRVVGWGTLLVIIAGIVWLFTLPKIPRDQVASYGGLHWHPHLSIKVYGKEIQIPANVGTTGEHVERPHTHDANNILHYEIPGIALVKDTTLKKFFDVWGKKLSSTCLVDECATGTSTVKMFVNGVPNTLYENYPIKDKDEIELILE